MRRAQSAALELSPARREVRYMRRAQSTAFELLAAWREVRYMRRREIAACDVSFAGYPNNSRHASTTRAAIRSVE
jgi:hypothetical protein